MENQTKKEVVFSAIQPSGTITLGNYLGAVRNWVTMQNAFSSFRVMFTLMQSLRGRSAVTHSSASFQE